MENVKYDKLIISKISEIDNNQEICLYCRDKNNMNSCFDWRSYSCKNSSFDKGINAIKCWNNNSNNSNKYESMKLIILLFFIFII